MEGFTEVREKGSHNFLYAQELLAKKWWSQNNGKNKE